MLLKLWTHAEQTRAVRMRRCGCPVEIIALRLGRTRHSVSQKMKDLGVTIRPRPHASDDLVRRHARGGMYDCEISDRLNIPLSTVGDVRRRLGVKANHEGRSVGRKKSRGEPDPSA